MSETVLSTNTLPLSIRERFSTQRVTVRNYESGVILMPLSDIISLRGTARGSAFTVDALLANRREDSVLEDGEHST
ncbi:MAG: hypothetical protein FWF81_06410 [Defluviitaleaceae bacterium]|nr:hypothetical protein [Defluviitaleaceae bacterium]